LAKSECYSRKLALSSRSDVSFTDLFRSKYVWTPMTLAHRIDGQIRPVDAPPNQPLPSLLRELQVFLLRQTAPLFGAGEGPWLPPFGGRPPVGRRIEPSSTMSFAS
jgi:hypothetical protein